MSILGLSMVLFLSGMFFIFGAIVASFVGVLVVRLNTGQSFLSGHSRCDACNRQLTWTSLVPVISFFVARGRSLCCGSRITPLAPLSELVLGLLFVWSYISVGISITLLLLLLALALILALVLYDLSHQILPSQLLSALIVVSIFAAYVKAPDTVHFLNTAVVALVFASFLAAIHFFSHGRAMGFADAPLAFALALLTGSAALSGFVFSFWIGAVIGIVLLARRPAGSRMGVEVPFAPFLAAGFLLAYFTQWSLTTFIF